MITTISRLHFFTFLFVKSCQTETVREQLLEFTFIAGADISNSLEIATRKRWLEHDIFINKKL